MKGKPRLTVEEREKMKDKRTKKRDNFEKKNLGDYELIFPSAEEPLEEYQKFLSAAKSSWEDFNQGSFKKKSVTESIIQLENKKEIEKPQSFNIKELSDTKPKENLT